MKFLKTLTVLLSLILICNITLQGQVNQPIEDSKNILPLRERVKLTEKWWSWKYENVLPMVMREQGVKMWIVRDDEADLYYNNRGPVYVSLLKANHQGMTYPSQHSSGGSQRVPGFLMFYDTGEKIEFTEPRDYEAITELVRAKDPDNIAIAEHNKEKMLKALGNKYAGRTTDSWTLGVRWLETMGPERISLYKHVQRVACEVIAEAFSNSVVIPVVSTETDTPVPGFPSVICSLNACTQNIDMIFIIGIHTDLSIAGTAFNADVRGTDTVPGFSSIVCAEHDIFAPAIFCSAYSNPNSIQDLRVLQVNIKSNLSNIPCWQAI